ncbi:MAG: TetR/AcrR family transcriptional regulator [Clostridiales bacterium]|nr:TetR/AcrR family transcriptional regulator [Clostridiales bacterium]
MSEEKKAAATRYHRKTLLDAADRLLMQYGYDGMNMNMLAKEAGYSKATVYVYLSSKDEIVRLLCIERLKLLRKEFSVILKNDGDAQEKLEAVLAVLDEFAAEDSTYFDFICSSEFADEFSEAPDSAKQLSALVKDILDELSALMPREELKNKWYAYYGRIKTEKMFGKSDGAKK